MEARWIVILEVAVLNVLPGRAQAFEAAFREASGILASMEGYRKHSFHRCLEITGRYLLLVEWETLEHHTEGFRRSPEYQRWKALLHDFYEPFPEVEHYREISLEG